MQDHGDAKVIVGTSDSFDHQLFVQRRLGHYGLWCIAATILIMLAGVHAPTHWQATARGAEGSENPSAVPGYGSQCCVLNPKCVKQSSAHCIQAFTTSSTGGQAQGFYASAQYCAMWDDSQGGGPCSAPLVGAISCP